MLHVVFAFKLIKYIGNGSKQKKEATQSGYDIRMR